MSKIDELKQEALRIRNRLMNPPNAVPDTGIDLTRKSTAYKGDIPPPDTPPKKKLEPEVIHPPVQFPIKFDDILQEVCFFYKMDPVSILSGDRRATFVMVRRIIVFLALKLIPKKSVSSIARDMNKDHTTTLHARNKIKSRITEDRLLLGEIGLIEEKILAQYRLRSTGALEQVNGCVLG